MNNDGNPNGVPDDAPSHKRKPCPICGEEHYQLPYHIREEHE